MSVLTGTALYTIRWWCRIWLYGSMIQQDIVLLDYTVLDDGAEGRLCNGKVRFMDMVPWDINK